MSEGQQRRAVPPPRLPPRRAEADVPAPEEVIGIPAKLIADQAKELRATAPKPGAVQVDAGGLRESSGSMKDAGGLSPGPSANWTQEPGADPSRPVSRPPKPPPRSKGPKSIADQARELRRVATGLEAEQLPRPVVDQANGPTVGESVQVTEATKEPNADEERVGAQHATEIPAGAAKSGTDPSGEPEQDDELRVVSLSPGPASIPDQEAASGAARAHAVQPDAYTGRVVDDRYKLEKLLGEGGMGVVYQCRHTIIDKKVAMKILRADLARDQEATRRFLNEAKSASAIGNPHIIDISDFGRLPDGSTYFVMEYLEGLALSSLIKKQIPVSPSRILHIARQLAEALAAAHHAGIVHRDLKPDNIFLVERGTAQDFVKILDFGIAKVSGGEGRVTQAGAVFGTPHYMSPEQAAGDSVDHRGDIYSLGVILYELAAGKVPFDAENFMGILTQHIYKTPMPLRSLEPKEEEVPPGLEAVILKCLSKKPENRYASMEDLCADLASVAEGFEPSAVPDLSSRSDDFNVPVEYFRIGVSAGKIRAAAPPRGARRWLLYAGIASALGALLAVLTVTVLNAWSTAAPPKASNGVATPSVVPEVAHSRQSPPERSPNPAKRADSGVVQVALAVVPLDARVFRGDQDLGKSPVLVEVATGTAVKVTLRRPGYQSRTIELDGSEERRSVKLQRKRSSKRSQSNKLTKPSIGGGDIVNPWD